jgi:uncharacterized delta-60 repeat protein
MQDLTPATALRIAAATGTPLLVAAALAAAAYATGDGRLDPTFGRGGRVVTVVGKASPLRGSPSDDAEALIVQPNGKLVAAGSSVGADGVNGVLIRYLRNGTLDPTFGKRGIESSPGLSFNALLVQPDGKLVAAGQDGLDRMALRRYRPDGRPDASFGIGGIVSASFAPAKASIDALIRQPDGKIVIAGGTNEGNSDASLPHQIVVARYGADGRLDPTFGNGGKVVTTVGTFSQPRAVVAQADGRIVIAGHGRDWIGGDFVLLRYLRNGRPDASFGTRGIVETQITSHGSEAFAVVVQPDGKLVAAGSAWTPDGNGHMFALVRYTANGKLDPSFGRGGVVTAKTGEAVGRAMVGRAMVRQPGGKLVVAGAGGLGFLLARFQANGVLDRSFGNRGFATNSFGKGSYSGAAALVRQADGNLVLLGFTFIHAGAEHFALARYITQ